MIDKKWYEAAMADEQWKKSYNELAKNLIAEGWQRSNYKQFTDEFTNQFTKNYQAVVIVRRVGSSTCEIEIVEYIPVNEALEWFYSLEPYEQQAQIELRYQDFCSNL